MNGWMALILGGLGFGLLTLIGLSPWIAFYLWSTRHGK